MSDWQSTFAHSWLLQGLPDSPETGSTIYTFNIRSLGFFIPWEKHAVGLFIPARGGAEEPRYPEQQAWVKQVLAEYHISAEFLGWSHWRFASQEDAFAFEKILWKFGAMRLWRLWQRSKEPGVCFEYFFFKITPRDAGRRFLLSVVSEPQLPALDKRAATLVRRVLSKHHIPAQKKRSQNCWEFDTINAVQRFEKSLQEMMSRYRTRTFTYAGQL